MNVLPNLVISIIRDKTGFSHKHDLIYLNTWVGSKCSESNFLKESYTYRRNSFNSLRNVGSGGR